MTIEPLLNSNNESAIALLFVSQVFVSDNDS